VQEGQYSYGKLHLFAHYKIVRQFSSKERLVNSTNYVKEYTISNLVTQRITQPRYVTRSGKDKRTRFTLERRLLEGKVVGHMN